MLEVRLERRTLLVEKIECLEWELLDRFSIGEEITFATCEEEAFKWEDLRVANIKTT